MKKDTVDLLFRIADDLLLLLLLVESFTLPPPLCVGLILALTEAVLASPRFAPAILGRLAEGAFGGDPANREAEEEKEAFASDEENNCSDGIPKAENMASLLL